VEVGGESGELKLVLEADKYQRLQIFLIKFRKIQKPPFVLVMVGQLIYFACSHLNMLFTSKDWYSPS
jgi:hypothetical protein